MTEPIILGATGRVGQALARVWPALAPRGIWQHRAGAEVIARFPAASFQWDMLAERALAAFAEATCLQLGNVAGTDALFQIAAHGPVTLDRFSYGTSPRRSYIGPVTLAQPGVLAMDRVLAAAGVDFTPQVVPPWALAVLEMDVSRLGGLVPLAPVDAGRLTREARAGGGHPHGSTSSPA